MRRRPHDDPRVIVVYLGPVGSSDDDLNVATVTGTEAEATAWIEAARGILPGAHNMWEDRPHVRASGTPALAPGERRRMWAVVTGPVTARTAREVCDARLDADQSARRFRVDGIRDADVLELISNQWLPRVARRFGLDG